MKIRSGNFIISNFLGMSGGQQREVILTFLCGVAIITGYILAFADLISHSTERYFYVFAYLTGGYHGFIHSVRYMLRRKLNIDVLMILAAIGAAIIDSWLEGAILLFLFSLSHALQHFALSKSRKEIRALMNLRPEKALVRLDDGTEELKNVDDLNIGDRIVVKPGERIPIDGEVISGTSSVDQSTITGESIPVRKSIGDPLFAATMNQNGVLEIKVTRRAGETTLAKIIRMVEEAQSEKAQTQRFLDKFEPKYAGGVILTVIALILIPWLVFSHEFEPVFYRAMTLLVVASPCALIISTPASILSAIASSAKAGVLFKGGTYLEQAAVINTFAFDKTGTLTTGRSEVSDIITFNSYTENEVLSFAASAEEHSEHHIGAAILRKAEKTGIKPPRAENVRAEIGKGIIADLNGSVIKVGNQKLFEQEKELLKPDELSRFEQLENEGKTVILVSRDERLIGMISIADQVRPEAAEAIQKLKDLGINDFAIITGDTETVAKNVGSQLKIENVHAGLLPDQKVEVIKRFTKEKQIAMVGDGVNDAPALAASNIGIAMGAAGTDVALETADIVLMSDDLNRLPWLIDLARRSKKVVWQNIIFSLSVIALLVGSVFLFELPLTLGVIAHEGSTLIVVLNGLRLLQ